MDKDLAPRPLFNYVVFTIGLVIVFVSILHLSAMDLALKSHDFGPFILTTSIWSFFLLALIIVFNKFRYVTTISMEEKKLRLGNLFSNSVVAYDKLVISGKAFGPLFRIMVGQKIYYILSSEKRVDSYKQWIR